MEELSTSDLLLLEYIIDELLEKEQQSSSDNENKQ